MGRLDGKVAIVTGGGGGIGSAVCKLLAQEGAAVVVNDLGVSVTGEGADSSAAQKTVDAIKAAGGNAKANYSNIADFEAVGAMVDDAVKTFGGIHIVVNIAGILRDRMIFNMTEAEWDAVIAVHLKGTFNLCRHASPRFREQKWGRYINFSSVSSWGSPGQPNYGAAKHGIIGLTLTLANSMQRSHCTANAITPGFVATRMTDSTPRGQAVLQQTGKPMSEAFKGTENDPERVAPLVTYLATPEASYINGQVIGIQGHTLNLHSHAEAYRILKGDKEWDIQQLFEMAPKTLTKDLTPPDLPPKPGETRPPGRTAQMQGDASQWKELAPGIKYWTWKEYFNTKRA